MIIHYLKSLLFLIIGGLFIISVAHVHNVLLQIFVIICGVYFIMLMVHENNEIVALKEIMAARKRSCEL